MFQLSDKDKKRLILATLVCLAWFWLGQTFEPTAGFLLFALSLQ